MEVALPSAHHRDVGATSRSRTERLVIAMGSRARLTGDTQMGRYTELALRVAVVAAFVLVLAAPFRW
jgi:hypothetical protein